MPEPCKLDYVSFQQAIYPYCSDLSGIREYVREKVGLLDVMTQEFFDKYILLAAGLDEADVGIHLEGDIRKSGGVSDSMLSRYRTGKSMKAGIVKAYLKKGTEERTKAHFEKYLLPTIVQNGEVGILYAIWQIIKNDDSIPQVYKDDFGSLNSIETLAGFLARVFVFVMTRDKDPKVALAIEDDNEKKIHPMVRQVVRDIVIRGESDMLIPVLDLLWLCRNPDTEEYERIGMRQCDRDAFLDATKELAPKLNKKYRKKYETLVAGRFVDELANLQHFQAEGVKELYEKYGIDNNQIKTISIGDNPGIISIAIGKGLTMNTWSNNPWVADIIIQGIENNEKDVDEEKAKEDRSDIQDQTDQRFSETIKLKRLLSSLRKF